MGFPLFIMLWLQMQIDFRNFFWPLFLFIIGMYLVPLSLMGLNFEFIPGNLGDARLNIYFLEHGYKWLSGLEKSFWDAPFFYPAPNVMAFSDNHLGTLPIYAIFRLMNFDRDMAFQFWILSLFIFNYFFCYFSLRKFNFSAFSSACGAFIFAFSMPIASRLGHIQLLPRFLVPVGVYFTWNYLTKHDLRALIGLCIAVVWQLYCTIYIGLFLIYVVASFVISYWLVRGKAFLASKRLWAYKKHVAAIIILLVLSTIVLLPLFLPYMANSNEYGLRPWEMIANQLPRVESYFVPPSGSFVWSWLSSVIGVNLPLRWEQQSFIGAVPLIAFFACFLLCFGKRPVAFTESICILGKTSIICFLILFISTLSFNGFSLYKFATLLPGVAAIRAVSRIIVVLSFLFSIFIAILFTFLTTSRSKGTYSIQIIIMVLLFTALSLDQLIISFPKFNKFDAKDRVDKLVERIKKVRGNKSVLVYMPDNGEAHWGVHLDAMLTAQVLNMNTVNGYSGNCPKDYGLCVNYDSLPMLLAWIETSRNRYLVPYDKVSSNEHPKSLFDDLIIIKSKGDDFPISDKPAMSGSEMFTSEICSIRSENGKYLAIGTKSGNNALIISNETIEAGQIFNLVNLGVDKIALKGANGKYVCAEGGGGREVTVSRNIIGEWEIFQLVKLGGDQVAIKAAKGRYLSVRDGTIQANSESIGKDELFKLLISEACSIRSENGKYLVTGTKSGNNALVARNETIGADEIFNLVNLGVDKIALKGANGKYVCAEGGGGREVTVSRDKIGEWEIFQLVKLGGEQVAIKAANGKFLSAKNGNVLANSESIEKDEVFTMKRVGEE